MSAQPDVLKITLCTIILHIHCSTVVAIQFLSGVVPLAEMAGFAPFLLKLLALPFFTLLDSRHPPSSNQFFCLFLHLLFQFFFGRPSFLLSLTSRFRATLKILSSSLLSTCPYHLTPFAVANRSIVPSTPACPSVLQSSFCQHLSDSTIALTLALPVFSFSFKHQSSLPYSIANLTQQR